MYLSQMSFLGELWNDRTIYKSEVQPGQEERNEIFKENDFDSLVGGKSQFRRSSTLANDWNSVAEFRHTVRSSELTENDFEWNVQTSL